LEFNLENSGCAIFPELVTVTFIGIKSSIFLHADPPDPTTLIYPLNATKNPTAIPPMTSKPVNHFVTEVCLYTTKKHKDEKSMKNLWKELKSVKGWR